MKDNLLFVCDTCRLWNICSARTSSSLGLDLERGFQPCLAGEEGEEEEESEEGEEGLSLFYQHCRRT